MFVLGAAGAACGTSAPQPPIATPPAGAEPILGNERIGWDQRAGDNVELSGLRYAIYVDNARSELAGVTCADSATDAGYACSAQLPRMTAGTHTLELAAFLQDGSLPESSRSAALLVTVSAGTSTSAASGSAMATAKANAATASWPVAVVRLA